MAGADRVRLWVESPGTRSSPAAFATALIVAFTFHLFVILGVGFELPKPATDVRTTRPLEVVVLRQAASTEEKPESVDALAQVDRVGGSLEETPEAEVESTPEVVPEVAPPQEPEPPPIREPVAMPEPTPPEQQENTALTAILEPPAVEPELPEPEEPPALPEPEVRPEPRVTAAQILASRGLEIAKLTARIEDSGANHSSRLRRKAISASTREYKYANYLEAWRRKVEQIGNLNYPQEAKRQKLYGSLILHVAVRSDGSIERVRVLRSSGFDVLDEAAARIVNLAAPFAPFPPDIRAETDILDITRTWQFLSTNRLGWKN